MNPLVWRTPSFFHWSGCLGPGVFTALRGRHPGAMAAVRGKYAMISSGVGSGFGHQSGELGDEVRRFEDHMRSTVAIRGFELEVHLSIRCERQAPLGDREACDVTAQAFQFATFVPLITTQPGIQREAGLLTHCPAQPILGIAGRQRLHSKHFVPSLGPDRDAIGDGIAQQLMHGIVIGAV